MGNGFGLVKSTNESTVLKCLKGNPSLLADKFITSKVGKKDVDPGKERLHSTLLWLWLPRLPLEFWDESALEKVIKPVGKILKIDINSEVITNGLFAIVCTEVDISKPLQIKIKYRRDKVLALGF